MQRDVLPRRMPSQARGHRRFTAILDAAEARFGEVGFDATTVSEVAARAGVPIGSVYQYFPNKEAIGQAVAERTSRDLEGVYGAVFTSQVAPLPLPLLVDRLVDPFVQFMVERAGLKPLFEASRGWSQLPAAIDLHHKLVQTIAERFAVQNHDLDAEQRHLFADLTVRILGSLAPPAISVDGGVNDRMVGEVKVLLLGYLEARLEPGR